MLVIEVHCPIQAQHPDPLLQQRQDKKKDKEKRKAIVPQHSRSASSCAHFENQILVPVHKSNGFGNHLIRRKTSQICVRRQAPSGSLPRFGNETFEETTQSLHVYSSDPSDIERIAVKHMRQMKQIRVDDTDLNILTPQKCFQAAMASGSNMPLLIPEKEMNIHKSQRPLVSRFFIFLIRLANGGWVSSEVVGEIIRGRRTPFKTQRDHSN